MGMSGLPDMYTLRVAGPRIEGVHIRQTTNTHGIPYVGKFWRGKILVNELTYRFINTFGGAKVGCTHSESA